MAKHEDDRLQSGVMVMSSRTRNLRQPLSALWAKKHGGNDLAVTGVVLYRFRPYVHAG